MRRKQSIETYVESMIEAAALETAAKLEGITEPRTRLIKMAKNRASEALRGMTGGDISTAKKILAGQANGYSTTAVR